MKKFLLIIALGLLPIFGWSQTHITRIKGIEIGGGSSLNSGWNLNISPSYFIHQKSYLKIILGIDGGQGLKYDSIIKNDIKVSYLLYSADFVGYYTPVNIKDKNYLNFGLGISGIYNQVNNIQYTPNQSGFNIGGLITIENEFYFTKKVAIILNGRWYYYLNNNEINQNFTPSRLIYNLGIKKVF